MILTVTPNPCIDKTLFIDRIELGGKMRAPRYTCIAGGKGVNVARAVKAMGFPSTALAVLGGDTGRHAATLIAQQDGVPCVPVWISGMTRTITTVLEEPIGRQTVFFEPGPAVSAGEFARIVEAFRRALPGVQAVTFNGAAGDPSLRPLYRTLIPLARAAGARVVLDAYGPEFDDALEARPDLIKPNLAEAELALGRPLPGESDRWEALAHFIERGADAAVLSLGAEGALAIAPGGRRIRATPPHIREVNPVGSGDALVAGLAIGLHEGWPLEDGLRLGVAAGAANAMSWDIAHFTRAEVDALLGQVTVA